MGPGYTPDRPALRTSIFPNVDLLTVQRANPNPSRMRFETSLTIQSAHFIHGFLNGPELFLIGA